MNAYIERLWRRYWLAIERNDIIGTIGLASRLRRELAA